MSELKLDDFIDVDMDDIPKEKFQEFFNVVDQMSMRLDEKLHPVLDEWRAQEIANEETAYFIPDAIAESIACWIAAETSMWLGPEVGEQHRTLAGGLLTTISQYLAEMMYDGDLDEESALRRASN